MGSYGRFIRAPYPAGWSGKSGAYLTHAKHPVIDTQIFCIRALHCMYGKIRSYYERTARPVSGVNHFVYVLYRGWRVAFDAQVVNAQQIHIPYAIHCAEPLSGLQFIQQRGEICHIHIATLIYQGVGDTAGVKLSLIHI